MHIRLLGIEQLKSSLKSTRWEKLWDGLGGTVGLLDIFSDLSVVEVKAACKAIGRCARGADVASRRARVTELFKGLHPDIFPDATAKTNDLRPLTKFYQALVPSCTAELVDWVTSEEQDGRWRYVNERDLLEHHPDSIGRTAYRSVFEHQPPDAKGKDRLKLLSTRFPTTTTSETGFSASMAFALRLLHYIIETESKRVEDEWVMKNLIRPLLKRAIRKRASWSMTREIAMLIMEFLKAHRNAAKILTSAKGDVLHMVALSWSRRSALFETQLKHLLGTVFGNTTSFEDIGNLLAGVPKSRRYALLQLSFQEVMGVNLDSEQGLSRVRDPLPSGMLNKIEAPHALGLFKRLRSARGDVGLVDGGLAALDFIDAGLVDAGLVDAGLCGSVLATARAPNVYEGDPDIHYLVLLNRNGLYQEAESYAANVLEVRKKTTKTISNRDARAERALSVWACASASGSLRLLSETVQWARVFVRDQLTASKLFSAYYDETYRLLSGFLVHGNAALKPQILRRRVEVANAIMTDLLDIACSALREPLFRSWDWSKTIYLFTHVVKERVKLSAEMKKEMAASDEDMYFALWEDTVAMLLRVEKLINHEEYEKLDAATISGIVVWTSVFQEFESKRLDRDSWLFLDNLAKARNGLWTDLRPTIHPNVLALPEPFPRGLPVQHLLACWVPDVADLDEHAPFIFSRVEAALFLDPETALKPIPCGQYTQQVIGAFVDNYRYALRAYVPDSCVAQVKEKRLREVWNHATGPLSSQRMDSEEAYRYWKQFVPSRLQVTLSKIAPKKERVRWPVVPQSDDPSKVQEWNPLEGRPNVKIQARKLGKATYIDFSTVGEQAQLTRPSIQSHCKPPTPQVPTENSFVGSIWSSHRAGLESEAGALAAVLYLDAKYATAERLLPTPFPSPSDVRYPCLYLDEEFLLSNELRASDAAWYISTNIRYAPLPLVHKMAKMLMGRLNHEQNSHILEGAAYTLLCALSNSDRPGLAFGLTVQVITSQPSASSWHRILFNNGFLQKIPASDAREYISTYAEAIGRKLDAQKRDAKTRPDAEQSEKSINADGTSTIQRECVRQQDGSFIKITTLKSLAQILHGSNYIGDDASMKILSDLSRRVTHVDVRVSILKTLLSKLEVHRPKLWYDILSNLEAFIPWVGSLNERDPMSQLPVDYRTFGGSHQQSQIIAEESHTQSLTLPDFQPATTLTWQAESPMLNAIVNYFLELKSSQLLELYTERVLIPVVDALKEQTAKWTALFLRKYASDNVDISDTTLPPIPKGFQILNLILSKPGVESYRIPRTLLDQYVAYLAFRINPPAPIRRLNQIFEDKPALRSMPEVKTWLELYETRIIQPWSIVLPFDWISNFDIDEAGNNGAYITARAYQEAFLKIFRELLWADNTDYCQLADFMSTLYEGESLRQSWWNEHGRTTVEAMIAYINNIRTRVWERDPNRTPAVLPDIFPWRLLLLSYPLNNRSDLDPDEVRERNCKGFAQQLAAVLDEISGSVYHTKLEQIKDQVRNRQNAMLSAIYLGDISKKRLSCLTTPELLQVDLAANMILGASGLDVEPLEGRLKGLLDSWIASENEEVRRTGYRVRGKFFDANGERLQNRRMR